MLRAANHSQQPSLLSTWDQNCSAVLTKGVYNISAHRHQATWRSLIFNRRYTDTGLKPDDPANLNSTYINSDYYLDQLDIIRVAAQDYRELRQFLEGSEPNEAFEGMRAITGHGLVVASSVADLEDKTWAMYESFSIAACRIAAQATTPKGVLPFDFKRDTAAGGGVLPLRFYCRPGAGRPVIVGRRREGLQRPFAFQLLAFDPFAYDVGATSTNLGNLAGGNNTVTNPGNIYTKPVITITFSGAGAASVTLTNVTTGQSFVMNLSTFLNTNVLTIDTGRSTMKRDDGSNQFGARISGFLSQLYLLPGANTITWSVGTGITSVNFGFRGAYA